MVRIVSKTVHVTAMGTKMAVSFANLLKAAVEAEIVGESTKNHSCGKDVLMT